MCFFCFFLNIVSHVAKFILVVDLGQFYLFSKIAKLADFSNFYLLITTLSICFGILCWVAQLTNIFRDFLKHLFSQKKNYIKVQMLSRRYNLWKKIIYKTRLHLYHLLKSGRERWHFNVTLSLNHLKNHM